jgi:hypothetical protein
MSAKHTPGPWRYVSRNIDENANWASRIPYAIERAMGSCVAPVADALADPLVEVCSQPQAEANARLIAAAPDLLRVAELVVSWLDEEPGAHKLCDAARAAIQKATAGENE